MKIISSKDSEFVYLILLFLKACGEQLSASIFVFVDFVEI